MTLYPQSTDYLNSPSHSMLHQEPLNVRAYSGVDNTGASEGTWATSTAYTKGQWIKLSGGEVLECTTAGTSHGSTEPAAPGSLGGTVSDGTVTWTLRSSTSVAWKEFGVIDS